MALVAFVTLAFKIILCFYVFLEERKTFCIDFRSGYDVIGTLMFLVILMVYLFYILPRCISF